MKFTEALAALGAGKTVTRPGLKAGPDTAIAMPRYTTAILCGGIIDSTGGVSALGGDGNWLLCKFPAVVSPYKVFDVSIGPYPFQNEDIEADDWSIVEGAAS